MLKPTMASLARMGRVELVRRTNLFKTSSNIAPLNKAVGATRTISQAAIVRMFPSIIGLVSHPDGRSRLPAARSFSAQGSLNFPTEDLELVIATKLKTTKKFSDPRPPDLAERAEYYAERMLDLYVIMKCCENSLGKNCSAEYEQVNNSSVRSRKNNNLINLCTRIDSPQHIESMIRSGVKPHMGSHINGNEKTIFTFKLLIWSELARHAGGLWMFREANGSVASYPSNEINYDYYDCGDGGKGIKVVPIATIIEGKVRFYDKELALYMIQAACDMEIDMFDKLRNGVLKNLGKERDDRRALIKSKVGTQFSRPWRKWDEPPSPI